MTPSTRFRILLLTSALGIATIAGGISVYGLGKLFAGSIITVMVLAVALEVGKLVAASYLKRFWTQISLWFRFVMLLQVLGLMFITSSGIYGFLASAYQQVAASEEVNQLEIERLTGEKTLLEQELAGIMTERQTLTNRGTAALTGARSRGAINAANRAAEAADLRATELSAQSDSIRADLSTITRSIVELQGSSATADIGPIRFVATAVGIDPDKAANLLILLIIIVFDPLAILLLLAYNKALEDSLEEQTRPTEKTLQEEIQLGLDDIEQGNVQPVDIEDIKRQARERFEQTVTPDSVETEESGTKEDIPFPKTKEGRELMDQYQKSKQQTQKRVIFTPSGGIRFEDS